MEVEREKNGKKKNSYLRQTFLKLLACATGATLLPLPPAPRHLATRACVIRSASLLLLPLVEGPSSLPSLRSPPAPPPPSLLRRLCPALGAAASLAPSGDSRACAKGGVCVRHCRTAFMKQVLPRFWRPAPWFFLLFVWIGREGERGRKKEV